jgi:hypothetical protein
MNDAKNLVKSGRMKYKYEPAIRWDNFVHDFYVDAHKVPLECASVIACDTRKDAKRVAKAGAKAMQKKWLELGIEDLAIAVPQ